MVWFGLAAIAICCIHSSAYPGAFLPVTPDVRAYTDSTAPPKWARDPRHALCRPCTCDAVSFSYHPNPRPFWKLLNIHVTAAIVPDTDICATILRHDSIYVCMAYEVQTFELGGDARTHP